MDVKLNDENMKDIIAKAVLDSMTPESRSEMIQSAIKSLLVTPTGNSYNKKSPLQDAFDDAVREVARQTAREQIVGSSEIATAITAMISEAWTKLMTDENRTKLVDRLVSALEKGLTGDRY